MCPPAILDRLNPLLERPPIAVHGSSSSSSFKESTPIVLAEAPPSEDGSPVLMTPHPDFRIFFVCRHGGGGRAHYGLSRALLDRSLRIFISAKGERSTSKYSSHDTESGDCTCRTGNEQTLIHRVANDDFRDIPLLQPEVTKACESMGTY